MQVKNKNDLSLRLLEIFGTMMMNQTTADTAVELGISQPAVSMAIKQLEAQIGFSLFERRNQRLQPTEEGHRLFAEIEPILLQLRSVESHVRELRDGTAGNLKIMATPPLGHSVIPPALCSFLASRPGVTVHYDVRRLESVIKEIQTGSVEMGLVLGIDNHPAVNIRILHSDLMVALMRPDHPLADASRVTPKDCMTHGFIGLDHFSRLGVLSRLAFGKEGVPYQPRVIVRYCHTSGTLANANLGVAIVDRYTADQMTDQGMIALPFFPEITIGACLLTRRGAPLSRLGTAFIETIFKILSRKRSSSFLSTNQDDFIKGAASKLQTSK
ncbi:MAG: LysR substrate-binding domain-containing protein [Paracoccaceae bacterium]|nr:LysR substrate-binding domain-containing protein [Paracoccaceae bacterium]